MKLVIITAILAAIGILVFVDIHFNQQYVEKSYSLELCRDTEMARYEKKWDTCCYKHFDTCPGFSCENGWSVYSSQMTACK